VDGLSLADLVRYRGHHLEHFLRYGAVGLMSLAGQHRSRAGAAATLGNSVPLSVGNAGELAFNTTEVVHGEEASLTYRRRTGWDAPPAGIVLPAWPEILAANGGKAIGLLGEALHGAGLATACLGNGDLDDEWHRVSALIASDSQGRVDYGDVSRGVLKPRPEGLLPLETDEGRVLDLLSALPPAAALVVIDFGDSQRLARLSRSALPAVLEAEKARLVARLDPFLGAVLATHDLAYTQVYVLGLTPAQSALEQQNLLVPVLALGANTGPGLLTSATTRRPGLVSNLDFAPSVLSFL
ncbi:MAG: hypothetical protein H5U01_07090, partial [Clostridia bacterium]|nr:hypothetical protein [Clostridia bacterium]